MPESSRPVNGSPEASSPQLDQSHAKLAERINEHAVFSYDPSSDFDKLLHHRLEQRGRVNPFGAQAIERDEEEIHARSIEHARRLIGDKAMEFRESHRLFGERPF